MKHINLLLFSVLLTIMSFGQNIQNTVWQVFNAGLGDTITIYIGVDSVNQYDSNGGLVVASLYDQNADSIWLVDVSGPLACLPTDTGLYTIAIANDTLTLTLVGDPCMNRGLAYSGAKLWRVQQATSVAKIQKEQLEFRVYPNPSSGIVSISSKEEGNVRIMNTGGQIIISQPYDPQLGPLDFHLSQGMYIVEFSSNTSRRTGKLLVR